MLFFCVFRWLTFSCTWRAVWIYPVSCDMSKALWPAMWRENMLSSVTWMVFMCRQVHNSSSFVTSPPPSSTPPLSLLFFLLLLLLLLLLLPLVQCLQQSTVVMSPPSRRETSRITSVCRESAYVRPSVRLWQIFLCNAISPAPFQFRSSYWHMRCT